MKPEHGSRFQASLLGAFALVYALSATTPMPFGFWFMQSLTPLLAAILLFTIRERFRLSDAAALCVFAHGLLMLAGAYFRYSHIPGLSVTLPGGMVRGVGDWLAHFTVSFPLVFVARDLLARFAPLERAPAPRLLLVAVSMACAIAWELIEWGVSTVSDDAFNRTAGFAYDTYVDLALTLCSTSLLAWLIRLESRPARGAAHAGPPRTPR